MLWLVSVLVATFVPTTLAGPAISPPTARPILRKDFGDVGIQAPAPTQAPLIRRAGAGDPYWCTPAHVESSCPSLHCICTSTLPQPWKVETLPPVGNFAALTLTQSQGVYVYDTVSNPPDGNFCPYTRKEDSGPSIYIAAEVAPGSCGPPSLWSNDAGPTSSAAPPSPGHGPGGAQCVQAGSCSLGGDDGNMCTCPQDCGLPRMLNPGDKCGDSLQAPYNCETSAVRPVSPSGQDQVPDMTAVFCLDPSDGYTNINDVVIVTHFHLLQPGDPTGKGEKMFTTDPPILSATFNDNNFQRQTFMRPDCNAWFDLNGKVEGFGKYSSNPCSGFGLSLQTSCSAECSNTKIGGQASCACGTCNDGKRTFGPTTVGGDCNVETKNGNKGAWGTFSYPVTMY